MAIPYWLPKRLFLSIDDKLALHRGEEIVVGSRRFGVCMCCHRAVQLNRMWVGSVHVCGSHARRRTP